jgi:phenylalanyl-tRNA synthetase beta chain
MLANSLTTESYIQLSASLKEDFNVHMLNPLSQDLAVMRQSLLFSGLEAISYNINRKKRNLKLFEYGKTYHNYPSGREEHKHLTLLVSGNKTSDSWKFTSNTSDFFYLKGVVSSVIERLGFNNTQYGNVKADVLSEGMTIQWAKKTLVEFGVVKKSILKHFDIDQEVLFADFNWDVILENVKHQKIKFKDLPRYPEVRRDFALLLDDSVAFKDIKTIARQSEKQLLKEVVLFDVYQGKNLPKGKKSYAVSFTLQDENKTLTDKQIDKVMNKLQASFEKQLGAELR